MKRLLRYSFAFLTLLAAQIFWGSVASAQSALDGFGGGGASSAQVIAALGYTPVNKAGDTMTGALSIANGANPQAAYVYNTFTDVSNYERGVMSWSGNTLTIGAAAAGTGTKRGVQFAGANFSMGGIASTNVLLRMTGTGTGSATHGLYVTDSSGLVNLDVLDNGSTLIGRASLATTATAGFPYVPAMAGAATGVPAALTGMVPIWVDTTNNKICFYNGALKCAAGL